MILLIQPPFVQLNAPYPSLYYLRSFLEQRGYTVQVDDHSIALFHRIFSRPGLERIFADGAARLDRGQKLPPHTASIARRYLSQQELWLAHIDRLIAFLQGKDREYANFLALCNNTLPLGPRAEALLSANDYTILPDQAKILASTMLADLADFITVLLDPTFSLVKYADSLAASIRNFSQAASALDGYILQTFYDPLLKDTWNIYPEPPELIGLTIPFPGCLAGALYAAGSAKERYGRQLPIIAGGGYVTTELRHIRTRSFFNYIDFLAYDRGYGALQSVLDFLRYGSARFGDTTPTLHHCIYRTESGDLAGSAETGLTPYDSLDQEATERVYPDYRGIDFDRYILPVDDTNPMHRLWTEGRWLKAYAAHGCYWHACAFCDVTLDYIRGFQPVPIKPLFQHLVTQAQETGIRGIHLVDEAAPVNSLIELALLNREAGLPLTFWGNIRFEGAFTPDVAALLAAGGLLGVSGGIEVASEAGFKRLGKGIGLTEVVFSCASFKEAGILTHAYLIYGYWDQKEQEIIDAAETLRQLFAAGLIDSAFWHKFVLTRHSRIYRELTKGRHKDLHVIDEPSNNPEDHFADNDLRFKGEERYDRYTQGLDLLLSEWMRGSTERPVQKAFPFAMPPPSIPEDRVQELLEAYLLQKERGNLPPLLAPGPAATGPAASAESVTAAGPKAATRVRRALFLGTRPWLEHQGATWTLRWRWNFTEWVLGFTDPEKPLRIKAHPPQDQRSNSETALIIQLKEGDEPEKTAHTLISFMLYLRQGQGMETHETYTRLRHIISPEAAAHEVWRFLRKRGLSIFP